MSNIYKPGENCWKTAEMSKGAILIDCAAYYRALYHALCKAKRSIFILGWDIDGRIELLRGEEAKDKEIPVNLFGLINHKAKENPDLKVYLNRWNYSIFFSKEREPFSGYKWHMKTPPNVFYCADYKLPFAACHHQKVIIIDDELVFCGGMDIALWRWDRRQHFIDEEERQDPVGIIDHHKTHSYMPYHDIQFMLSGPAVGIFSDLFRERWERAAGFDIIEKPAAHPADPQSWPEHVETDFENIEIGVARTMPKFNKETKEIREIINMYVDEIARAENFIYIENQYLTSTEIAHALKERVREKPNLRILAVSCDKPRGFMEHKAMWTGRVDFCDIVADDSDRLAITYPVTTNNEEESIIHIHSKLMIVDDKFLHVGSSNLNNRSMGFDTECDIIIAGKDKKSCSKINDIRNDLIREHTGRELEDIADIIDNQKPLEELLAIQPQSRQHLKRVDNEPYRNDRLKELGQKIGDPDGAQILFNLPFRQIIISLFVISLIAILIWSGLNPLFEEYFSEESFTSTLENARNSPWAFFWVVGLYVVAGMIFFPVTVLNLTTAIVFGPLMGFIFALSGSLATSWLSYFIGRWAGEKAYSIFRSLVEKVRHYTSRGGIIGMTLIRLVPIAPFTLINLTFGVAKAPFISYTLATIFGLMPGILAKAVFGGAISQLWENPEPRVIFYTAGSLLLWIGIIWASQHFAKKYKQEMHI